MSMTDFDNFHGTFISGVMMDGTAGFTAGSRAEGFACIVPYSCYASY